MSERVSESERVRKVRIEFDLLDVLHALRTDEHVARVDVDEH